MEIKKELRELRKELQNIKNNSVIIDYEKLENLQKAYVEIGFSFGKETTKKLMELLIQTQEIFLQEAQEILEEMYAEEERIVNKK